MQTVGSCVDWPSTALFATLPVTASGHPGNLSLNSWGKTFADSRAKSRLCDLSMWKISDMIRFAAGSSGLDGRDGKR